MSSSSPVSSPTQIEDLLDISILILSGQLCAPTTVTLDGVVPVLPTQLNPLIRMDKQNGTFVGRPANRPIYEQIEPPADDGGTAAFSIPATVLDVLGVRSSPGPLLIDPDRRSALDGGQA